jgi:anti-anti-sigma regulatory factor
VLVEAHRRARLQGRELVLCDAVPRVARLLALTRLDRVITVDCRGSVLA